MAVPWNCCNLCLCSWDAASNGPNDGTHGSYDEGANDGTTKKTNEMITHRMCVVAEDISMCGWCDVWGLMLKVILFHRVFLTVEHVLTGEKMYTLYMFYMYLNDVWLVKMNLSVFIFFFVCM